MRVRFLSSEETFMHLEILSLLDTGSRHYWLPGNFFYSSLTKSSSYGHLPDIRGANRHTLKPLWTIIFSIKPAVYTFYTSLLERKYVAARVFLKADLGVKIVEKFWPGKKATEIGTERCYSLFWGGWMVQWRASQQMRYHKPSKARAGECHPC